jgi:hypothetical protein
MIAILFRSNDIFQILVTLRRSKCGRSIVVADACCLLVAEFELYARKVTDATLQQFTISKN